MSRRRLFQAVAVSRSGWGDQEIQSGDDDQVPGAVWLSWWISTRGYLYNGVVLWRLSMGNSAGRHRDRWLRLSKISGQMGSGRPFRLVAGQTRPPDQPFFFPFLILCRITELSTHGMIIEDLARSVESSRDRKGNRRVCGTCFAPCVFPSRRVMVCEMEQPTSSKHSPTPT